MRLSKEISQTELFDAAPAELDFVALAAQPDVSVMRPQGKRIGAQLPDQPAQWAAVTTAFYGFRFRALESLHVIWIHIT